MTEGRTRATSGVQSFHLLQILAWGLCLAPAVRLGDHIAAEFETPGSRLGADPALAIIHYLGEWGLILLLATLTLGFLARLAGWRALVRFRRLVGLFAFSYLLVHFVAYLGLLAGFDTGRIAEDLSKRPYIIAGFTGLLCLVPLALTSTRGWQRRLGSNWKRLHRMAYAAAMLGVLHLFWLSKDSYADAVFFGVWLGLLLMERLPWRRPAVRNSPI